MAIVDLAVGGIVAVFFGFILWANIYHKRTTLREPPRDAAGALQGRREDERSSA